MALPQEVQALFAGYQAYEEEIKSRRTKPSISVSRAVSFVAYTFERIRNSIDYRDDHFLRRASIARSLTRKFTIQIDSKRQAWRILQELVLARYFPSEFVPEELTEDLARVIEKYKRVLPQDPDIRDWLIKIAAVEIDRMLVPPYREDALTNLFFSALENSVELPQETDKEGRDRLVYLAAARAAVRADASLLSFLLLNAYYPGWLKNDEEAIEEVKKNLPQIYAKIQTELTHPSKEPLLRFFSRRKAPLLILADLAEKESLETVQDSLQEENEEALLSLLSNIYRERFRYSRNRFNRAATRAIIYIFLTKILFLLLLELPFEKIFFGEVNFITLGINLTLPPVVLFLIVNAINLPGEKNERKVTDYTLAILKTGKIPTEIFIFNPRLKPKVFSLFRSLYWASLALILVGTFSLFLKIGFSIPSTVIMILFLSLVIFFGFLIREQARELMLEEKEGLLTPVVNFLSLPFIRAGRFLSGQLTRFNILIFLLDVFLEAPFKAFFRIAQHAVRFVKEKHEEAITQVP